MKLKKRWLAPRKQNVLVIGDKGQLGSYLKKFLSEEATLENSQFGIVSGVDLPEVDVSNEYDLKQWLDRNVDDDTCPIKFHWVINCAASTNTSKIQTDFQEQLDSYQANVIGPRNIAKACVANGSKLIHVSTDYVFSEYSLDYSGTISEFPTNMYGIHKLLGEKMVECEFSRCPKDFMILRTSWLYGNSKNSFPVKFLTNCLKAADTSSKSVSVVNDCFGRPTSVQYLARFIASAIANKAYGKLDAQAFHKPISRYAFAKDILDKYRERLDIVECTSSESLMYSRLDDVEVVASLSNIDETIHHPRMMPHYEEKPAVTSSLSISTKLFSKIVNDTNCASDPNSMFEEWLVKFGGFDMLQKWLEEAK